MSTHTHMREHGSTQTHPHHTGGEASAETYLLEQRVSFRQNRRGGLGGEILVEFIKEQPERLKKAQEEPTERTEQNSKNHYTDSAAYHRNSDNSVTSPNRRHGHVASLPQQLQRVKENPHELCAHLVNLSSPYTHQPIADCLKPSASVSFARIPFFFL